MLTDAAFVAWANANLVVVVPHNELGHEEVTENPKAVTPAGAEPVRRCSLYPGLSCRDHLDLAVDVDVARGEDLVRVPFIELCPNTWLVAPGGEVEPVAEEDQFVPKAIRRQAERVQKTAGPALSLAKGQEVLAHLREGDAALEEERFAEALAGWSKAEKAAGKVLPPSLERLLERRLDDLEEGVGHLLDDLEAAGPPTADSRAKARALHEALGTRLLGRTLPTRTRLAGWLASHGK